MTLFASTRATAGTSAAFNAHSVPLYLALFGVGVAASTVGSMVGLGGGFLMVPLLRLFFALQPAEAAGTSLVLVFANSLSGSFAYLRQRRIDVRTALLLAAGGFPAGIVGAVLVTRVSGVAFDALYAVFLIVVGLDLFLNREKRLAGRSDFTSEKGPAIAGWRAIALGIVVGLVSSVFGIGGGVVVVPALLYLSTLPAISISATSQFAILLTSPVGLVSHLILHDVAAAYALPLVFGGLLGGQIGAKWAAHLSPSALTRALGFALAAAAVALLGKHLL
ncbi:MAG: sulfite exporter TauE/SafE family protein [Candidatus Eremiobacteraeota bacterium]|nr:sulfite exporter TauE/SafE family protein [Candidatus Eremiobacteraeota bacterium]